ncbi:MAG: DinB family protein [Mucilaginibacter polytrichastri]|nr:DinB family protein [Mucilaginibacter polytrichastri]
MTQEPWLRGPLPGFHPLLQPVAHALTQSLEDVKAIAGDLPEEFLWVKPAGRASAGFHLQHISGVLDRMMTYARGEKLDEAQLDELSDEGHPFRDITKEQLVALYETRIAAFFEQLKNTPENSFTEERGVGRRELPSTVIGLLFHAAEHVQRHTGQLLVTASVVGER